MTDYYPLLARAVAGLEKNTGEARRALYERARTALVAQLRSVEPPLSESEITRERLTLEESVRKVEAEAARQLRAPPQEAQPRARLRAANESVTETFTPRSFSRPERERSFQPRDTGLPNAPSLEAAEPPPAGGLEEARRGSSDIPPGPEGIPPAEPPPPDAHVPQPGGEAWENREPVPGPLAAQMPDQGPVTPADDWEGAPRRRAPGPISHYGHDVEPNPARRGLFAALLSILVIAGLGGAAYWQRERISAVFGAVRGLGPQAGRDQTQTRPKATDRVGQEGPAGTTRSETQPGAAVPVVAQRVVLYEEDPQNSEGNRYVGSALWRTETVSPGPGLSPELAVRADVEVPERRLAMTMSIRRNTDQALPASHTVEIMFNLPADFAFGGVANVPGLLMKEAEQTRGAPLSGLAVKVTGGFFLIGLSAVESDVQRNLQLLKERSWFDIPIVYNNGRRAILAVEKGTPGDRAFNEAFATWGR